MTRLDLTAWVPRGVEARSAEFARGVVGRVDPPSWARARSLLWAASRLCDFALSVGLEPDPAVVLSAGSIERFIVSTRGWSSSGRRTMRSNLLFLSRRVVGVAPQPLALGRERAQAPYDEAELAAYLSLADAQPTEARRQRAAGLIALGAGAGLIGCQRPSEFPHRRPCNFPADGHEKSPGTAIRIPQGRPRELPADGHVVGRVQSSKGFTPLPEVASARRTDSPSVTITWAW